MLGLRKLRFVDIGTGLSMMLGTAGMLVASALLADDPQCAAPSSCTSNCSAQAAPCCDGLYQDAANRLKGFYAGLSSDGCAAPATPAPICGSAAPASSCGSAGGCAATGCGCGVGGPLGKVFDKLGSLSLTDVFNDSCGNNVIKNAGFKLGGNIAASYAMNYNNPQDRFNGPVTWPDRSNEAQLNQLWLYGERVTDTSNKDWDWGARGDIFYGSNARLTTESGLEEPRLNSSRGLYGIAIPQFYGDIAYKKWKLRVGHFISPIGYFTVDTTQNFFNTIPYTYQWGEPFTHTGAMLTWQVTDSLVVSSGMIKGWDNFDGHNPHMNNLTTWGYTFKDKSNLTQVIVASQEPNFYQAFTQRYYQSLVYTKPIDDNWTWVSQTDFGTQRGATYDNKTANWYGWNNYLYYKANDCWTWGANFEWWRDEEGYRVAGFLPGGPNPGNMAVSGITGNNYGVPLANLPGGYNGNFWQTTIGPRWYPTGKPNFFIRPNFRLDWYTGSINTVTQANALGAAPAAAVKPFGGNNLYQPLFITDVCILF